MASLTVSYKSLFLPLSVSSEHFTSVRPNARYTISLDVSGLIPAIAERMALSAVCIGDEKSMFAVSLISVRSVLSWTGGETCQVREAADVPNLP